MRAIDRRMAMMGGAIGAVCFCAGAAHAAELKVLSAGALEPAMAAAADGFRRQTGNAVRVDFATANEIRERGQAPIAAELVAGTDALVEELTKAGRTVAKPVDLGRIGLGVAVNARARLPDVSTADKLRAALLASRAVIYNRASSGQGIEAMIRKLGIADQLAARTERFPDAEAVMSRLIAGGPGDIGFGAPTAISLYAGKNLKYAGPIPAELQSYTHYAIVPTSTATPLAQAFLDYLASPEAKALIRAAGVQPR